MPTYVYQCPTCNERFERWQSFNDAPLAECPQGHAGVRRVFTPSPVIFKGSGWYVNDSRNGKGATNAPVKDEKGGPSSESSESTKSSESSEPKASTESKSSATKETTSAQAAD